MEHFAIRVDYFHKFADVAGGESPGQEEDKDRLKIAANEEEEEEEDIHGFTTQEDESQDPEIDRIVRQVLMRSSKSMAQQAIEQVIEGGEKGMNSIMNTCVLELNTYILELNTLAVSHEYLLNNLAVLYWYLYVRVEYLYFRVQYFSCPL